MESRTCGYGFSSILHLVRLTANVLRWLKLGIDKAMIAEGEGITIEQVNEIERANKGITA